MEVGATAMTNNEQDVLGLFDHHLSDPQPTFRVVYQRGVWIPPNIQRDLKEAVELTNWWLKKHNRWTDNALTITAPVLDDETGERSIMGYPLMDDPDLPVEQQDVSYYLGFDSEIYVYIATESGFIMFDPNDEHMQQEIRYIIDNLHLIRVE